MEYLADEFKKENSDHKEMTAPLVVANVTKEVHRYLALLKMKWQMHIQENVQFMVKCTTLSCKPANWN